MKFTGGGAPENSPILRFYAGFTVAHALVILVIAGVVAASILVPNWVRKYQDYKNLMTLRTAYSEIGQQFGMFKAETFCDEKLSDCFYDEDVLIEKFSAYLFYKNKYQYSSRKDSFDLRGVLASPKGYVVVMQGYSDIQQVPDDYWLKVRVYTGKNGLGVVDVYDESFFEYAKQAKNSFEFHITKSGGIVPEGSGHCHVLGNLFWMCENARIGINPCDKNLTETDMPHRTSACLGQMLAEKLKINY